MTADQIRLLLVEDVPQVAQYVRGLLMAQSSVKLLDVITDGSKAGDLVSELRPDVVIIDALLQGRVKGAQVVKQLRERGIDLPIVMLTVPQHPVAVVPGSGVHAVLAMPFSGYDLMQTLTRVVKEHGTGDRSPSRVVAVFAPKGGIGRTTIALNLAVAAAARLGVRTALIDGSIQFADVRALLRVPLDAPSILDLPTDRISETELSEVMWRDPSGIDILLAPPRLEMAEMVTLRDLDKTLSLMRRIYELIVIDTAITLDEIGLGLLDRADVILELVSYDSTTIHNTIAMADTFRTIGYAPTKVRYLLNRADSSGGISPAELAQALGRVPEHSIRSDGTLVVAANNQGVPFVLSAPDAPVSGDVIRVAGELLGAIRPVAAAAAR